MSNFCARNNVITDATSAENTMNTPPVVGVPSFALWFSGASSLIYCPTIFFFRKSMYGIPSNRQRIKPNKKATIIIII